MRLLFLEDSPADAELIVYRIQKEGIDLNWIRVDTREDFLAALAGRPDLILADYSLPTFSGLEAIRLLKDLGSDIPVILVSGTVGEDVAVEAMRDGAFDYLLKGKLTRLVPSIRNALEEKRLRDEARAAEAALRESEQRLAGILDIAAEAIISAGEDQQITIFNQGAEQIFGYRAEEVLGRPFDMLIPARFIEIHKLHVQDFLESPENARRMGERLEIFGRRKDGSEFPAEASISKLRMGRETISTVILRDVTERKQALEAAQRSEGRFRNLFENSPVSIWEEDFSAVKSYLDELKRGGVSDLEAYLENHAKAVLDCVRLVIIIDVNQAALQMHKAKSKAELLNGLERTLMADSLEAFKKELLTIANGGQSLTVDVGVRALDGERRDASLNWMVAPTHEADYSRVLVSLTDITERKRRERELEAIASVNAALRTAGRLDELLERLLDRALALVKCETGSIWLYNPAKAMVELAIHQGWGDNPAVSAVRLGQGIPGFVVKSGELILSRDLRNDPRVVAEARVNIPEGIGGACIPLHAAENVVGALFVNVELPREFSADDLRVLNALAEIGGSAIHRARLHEQTKKQLERMGALRSIDMAISGSIDLRLSLNIVLEQVLAQLGVDAASVLLLQPGSSRLTYFAGRGFRAHAVESTNLRVGEGHAGRAALEKQIVHIEDLASTGEEFARIDLLKLEEFVSYFAIPLIAKGEIKGILEIFHRGALHTDMEWLSFLDSLGWQTAVAVDNALLFEAMQRSNFSLAIAYDATIEGWSRALDLRDKETEGHTQRVTEMTLELARAMGFNEAELVNIRRGALLHDIGKMGVPDNILLKADKLTDEEWEIMKRHPQLAYEMLQPIAYLKDALDIPYCHHEKWDGTGYPRGLSGKQIPLAARLFAVVDVWDALTSDRPYREA
ncbi:MAG: HD domain-containing phosphohydrolase, partial [Chloroflexota bacterium]